MIKRSYLFALVSTLLCVGVAGAQFRILDMVADRVTQKYQQSSDEQLWQQKDQPKPAQEQEAIQMLRGDP